MNFFFVAPPSYAEAMRGIPIHEIQVPGTRKQPQSPNSTFSCPLSTQSEQDEFVPFYAVYNGPFNQSS